MSNPAGDMVLMRKRADRAENRIDALERDVKCLLDVNALLVRALSEHLKDRHDVDNVIDDAPDATAARRARARLRLWHDTNPKRMNAPNNQEARYARDG